MTKLDAFVEVLIRSENFALEDIASLNLPQLFDAI